MKKLVSLLILSLVLSSCGPDLGSKVPDMPEELKTQFIEAIQDGEADLKKGRESISTYNNLGFSYQSLNEYDEALEYYEKTLELDVKNYQALNNSLDIYREQDNKEKIKEMAMRLYEAEPNDSMVLKKIVAALIYVEEPAIALEALENFSRQQGEDPTYTSLISELYEDINAVE